MANEEVYDAAKTSAKMVLGIIFSLAVLVFLGKSGVINFDFGIDPTVLIIFIGSLMSLGILAYFIDQLEWL